MGIRKIVLEGDPILRKVCRPVSAVDDHIREVLEDMRETMLSADGVGLAGPQVGFLRRMFVVQTEDVCYKMVNPQIVFQEGEETDEEGCLSCPGKSGPVARPTKITVEYTDENGNAQSLTAEGLLARAICHENDHLDGI